MSKTFTFAGTSVLNGTVTYRFANDANRFKVLAKNGHTHIDLRELPESMTKERAIEWLGTQGIVAEFTRVVADSKSVNKPKPAATKGRARDQRAGVVNEDGFIEPEDERIQVDITRTLRKYPGLSRREAYETVMLTRGYHIEPSF